MRRYFGGVGVILASALFASVAIADDFADCVDCLLEEEEGPRWLLSMTLDDPDTRFGIAVGLDELSTPLERALTDAGIEIDSSWTIALRFEISL